MKVIFLEAYLFYLQKAFDTVDHNMLLKAKYYGVRGIK